jgi:hypothetical protein
MRTWIWRARQPDGTIHRLTYKTAVEPFVNETATAYHKRVLADNQTHLLSETTEQ